MNHAPASAHKRGLGRQRRRRGAERLARVSALAFARWCRGRGLAERQVAARLRLAPRTLERWAQNWRADRMDLTPRGRPAEPLERRERSTILAVLGLVGPHVGIPTLRELFPDVPRSALCELQRRYRVLHRRGKRLLVHVLRWTRPGTVWAIDFSQAPLPIDGRYPWILCVRDLAASYQLWALPCPDATAETVLLALAALERWVGLPLVLKCDNGSAFVDEAVRRWLAERGVLVLYSPPGTPAYNGAVEAGIGSLKTRAHHEAARHGRTGEWNCDDIEAAQAQANITVRPRGRHGAVAADVWHGRLPLHPSQRELFQATYQEYHRRERRAQGWLDGIDLQQREQAAIDRIAISRALIQHGYLNITRRRIPLPIKPAQCDKIT